MSTLIAPQVPLYMAQAGFYRLSVQKYHKMIEAGVLGEDDHIELLEGYMVLKMARNPPHDWTLSNLTTLLMRLIPDAWRVRCQMALTTPESEPEPDINIARGARTAFRRRHPMPADVSLVIEVADSTLALDRTDKGRIYARANLSIYWIVNVADNQIEVYTNPQSTAASPSYATCTIYQLTDVVPLILDGQPLGTIPVSEILG